MAKPKFLRVKNYERYQHYKKRNPPWVKLYKEFLTDYDLRQLPTESRLLYLGMVIIASETGNCTPFDLSYLTSRVGFKVSEANLRPLIKKHFLLASRNSVNCILLSSSLSSSDSSSSDEEGSGEKKVIPIRPIRPIPKTPTSYPDDFMFNEKGKELAESYGINPYKELAKFKDKHISKGSLFIDWQAAFRTWIRNADEFAKKRG